MNRTHYSHEITPDLDQQVVTVCGWVDAVRKLGNIAFLSLRDKEGKTQITLPKAKVGDLFKKLDGLTPETVVGICGTVKANKEAPNGAEIIPTKIEILSAAHAPLPMDISGKIKSELETRLDSRFMDLRQPKVVATFMVRDRLLTGIRHYLENEGFIEIHTPKIVAAGAEGGATMFKIDYFGKKAFLSQSPQLFKQKMMASGLDRVYEIAPAFRAEPSATTRHLSEFTSLDFEMAFIDSMDDVMQTLEEMIAHSISHVKKHAAAELEILGAKIEVPKTPFKRVTFQEAQEMLAKKGKKVEDDLDTEGEKMLGEIIGDDFYYIIDYPSATKPFYIMEKDDDPKYCHSFDLEFRGQELTSGGQREHRYDKLVKRMKAQDLKTEDFTFYLNAFKYGMPPHGGMGLGIERFVQKLLHLPNVRETVLFPRDQVRLTP